MSWYVFILHGYVKIVWSRLLSRSRVTFLYRTVVPAAQMAFVSTTNALHLSVQIQTFVLPTKMIALFVQQQLQNQQLLWQKQLQQIREHVERAMQVLVPVLPFCVLHEVFVPAC